VEQLDIDCFRRMWQGRSGQPLWRARPSEALLRWSSPGEPVGSFTRVLARLRMRAGARVAGAGGPLQVHRYPGDDARKPLWPAETRSVPCARSRGV